MNQPNFDNTNPNNLPYHVENLFVMVFAAINTTSRAVVDALYGNHIIFTMIFMNVKFLIIYLYYFRFGRKTRIIK
jgi:hypothetical protein